MSASVSASRPSRPCSTNSRMPVRRLGHHRQAGAAGLEGGDAEGLEVGRGDEDVGAGEELADLVPAPASDELDDVAEAVACARKRSSDAARGPRRSMTRLQRDLGRDAGRAACGSSSAGAAGRLRGARRITDTRVPHVVGVAVRRLDDPVGRGRCRSAAPGRRRSGPAMRSDGLGGDGADGREHARPSRLQWPSRSRTAEDRGGVAPHAVGRDDGRACPACCVRSAAA